MTAPSRVALVAPEGPDRDDLARYLVRAGFEVAAQAAPPRRSNAAALVWLTERDCEPAAVVAAVEAWLAPAGARRAVVVAWRPAGLGAIDEKRVIVLGAPVFGWQLVDALRGGRMLAR